MHGHTNIKITAVHPLPLRDHVITKSNAVKTYAHVCVSFQVLFTDRYTFIRLK